MFEFTQENFHICSFGPDINITLFREEIVLEIQVATKITKTAWLLSQIRILPLSIYLSISEFLFELQQLFPNRL